jgi:HK97 family phage portal protein
LAVNPFSWLYQKAVAGLAFLGYDSAPQLTSYWDFAQEAYIENPYAHSAIKMTARSVADIPARLYRIQESEPVQRALKNAPRLHNGNRKRIMREAVQREWQDRMERYKERTQYSAVAKHFAKKELIRDDIIRPVENHEVLQLLRRPNDYTQRSFQEFMISLVSYLEIGGMVFVEPRRGSAGTDSTLSSLRVRQPRDVELKRANGKPINEVKLTDSGGEEHDFTYAADPQETEVFYERYFHPKYPRFGLSPVEAAAKSVDVNNQAREWNLNLLFNSAQPSGVLSTEKQLGDTRRQRLKRDWRQKHSGPQNAGKVIVADGSGGAQFQATTMSPDEMQWGQLSRMSAREIAVVWNVPAQLIGDTQSQTYNNYRSARRSLYVEKVVPLTTKLYGFLNSTVIASYDEPLLLDYDTGSIDALKKEINEMHERAREDVQNTVLTVNEARDRIGEESVDGGDVLLVREGMIPLQAMPSDSTDMQDATLEPMDVGGEPKGDGAPGLDFTPSQDMSFFDETDPSDIDLDPPQSMVNAAELGMEKKDELDLNDCGTGEGEKSAKMITSSGGIEPDRMRTIASYLTRHEDEYPHGTAPSSLSDEQISDGCGIVQYLLWGGGTDEAFNWALRKANAVAEAEGDQPPYDDSDMKATPLQ